MRKIFEDLDEPMQRLFIELTKGMSKELKKRNCKFCKKEFTTINNEFCSNKCEVKDNKKLERQIKKFRDNKQMNELRNEILIMDRELKKLVGTFIDEYNKIIRKNNKLRNQYDKKLYKFPIGEKLISDRLLNESLYRERNNLDAIFDDLQNLHSAYQKLKEGHYP